MRKYLILFLLIGISSALMAQPTASVNLALRKKIESGGGDNEKMYLLIQGNVSSIAQYLKENNGTTIGISGDIVSAHLPVNAVGGLLEKAYVRRIGSDINRTTVLNDTMRMLTRVEDVHAGLAPLPRAYTGRGVILGIIDSGLDYNHPDFKDSLGQTRVKWLWDMTLTDTAHTPALFGYGAEFSNQDIDNGLAAAHTGEAQFGHGTYVAGIAAGNGSAVGDFQGVATESDLIIVSYDFSSLDTVPRYAHAVQYIFDKAQLLGLPAVINASLGDYYGSHDGMDLQSQYIAGLLQQPGRVVVAAAGNIGINYPFHIGRKISDTDTLFTWFKYNPANIGAYVQIFADTQDFNNIRFSIGVDKVSPYYHYRNRTPFTSVAPSINNVVTQSLNVGPNRLGVIQTYTTINDGVYSIEVYVVPDSVPQSNYNWRFITTGTGKYDSYSFDWVWQNLPPDSVFPDIIRYRAPDTTQSIVNGMACLDEVITVGNYYNTDRHLDYNNQLQVTPGDRPRYLAENSSRGPTRDGRVKPDITAPGHHIISCGVLSLLPGTIASQPYKVAPGGFHITGGGTSASAPVIAGIAALYLEQYPGANWSVVKSAIENCAMQDTFMWGPVPNNAWGYGKVDAFNMFVTCSNVVGIHGVEGNDFSIYPNPANTLVYVAGIEESSTARISIIDMEGRLIREASVVKGKTGISLEGIVNGFYQLQIITDNHIPVIRRFIVSH